MAVQTSGGVIEAEFSEDGFRIVDIESSHHEIHEGESFTVCTADESMGDNDTIVIAFKTPSGTRVAHMIAQASTLVGAHIEVIEGPTWDAESGTLLTIFNRNRDGTPASSIILENQSSATFTANDGVALNPTTFAGGTSLCTFFAFGSQSKIAPEARSLAEWMLKSDTQYAVRFTADGAANKGAVVLTWYEHSQATEATT